MIWLYDRSIAQDIENSFDPNAMSTPVKVIDPEGAVNVIAQIKNDELTFPCIVLTRSPNIEIDRSLSNFTMMHRGYAQVIDPETNNVYYEKSIPIKLNYDLTVLATNTADMDELLKELMFKYINMYYLTIQLPYESNRKLRFGIVLEDSLIDQSSGSFEYLQAGKLYQSILHLRCEGCREISYTPVKLRHIGDPDMKVVDKKSIDAQTLVNIRKGEV